MTQEKTKKSIMAQFCLDASKRSERLSLMGLGEAEYRVALLLHDAVIKPHHQEIVDSFYRLMMQNSEFLAIIHQHSTIEKQKKLMRTYIATLGLNYMTPEYFEGRLKIGLIHNEAGVSLSLYISAYRILQQLILDAIPRKSSKREVLIAYVLKITHLDMSLAIDAYHLDDVNRLENNLQRVTSSYEVLQQRQNRDSLTGVFSREGVLNLLTEDIERYSLGKRDFCIAMADIDHFKHVNDNFGHLTGDAVLHDVAARVQRQLRAGDIVGRYGGEEFLLLFHDISQHKAVEICNRIRTFVAGSPVKSNGVTVPITISMGVTSPMSGDTRDSLIARADKALYLAKNGGRNQVVEGNPE